MMTFREVRMATNSVESDENRKTGQDTDPPPHVAPAASLRTPEQPKLTYQVILRHLAKFRDGARALLDIFDQHATREAALVPSASPVPREVQKPEPQPKSPLELRIERHMGSLDRALQKIRDLNPDHKKKAELAPELRELIVKKERTIHDIVGAELHFWAASIENSPLDKFDEIERAWIRRMLRLANTLGVDTDHKEHLDFLKKWASQEHS
jgi:hypothetical protein